jgi:regulator of telomere elongation helicase 1
MVLLPIGGIEVDFPYEPYGVQRQYMARVIAALRAGENACLESPTGTGKSLALLCASLAWRQTYVAALQLRAAGGHDEKLFKAVGLSRPARPAGNPAAATAAGAAGDSGAPASGSAPAAPAAPDGERSSVVDALLAAVDPAAAPTELRAPRIVFSSRTHSQLAQAIGELKATVYRPFMTVLGSRDQLCIHDVALKHAGMRLNRACRQLTAPSRRGCKYHLSVMSPRDYENRSKALLQQLKDDPPKDIEDLGEFGMREGACPWYLTRAAATSGAVEILFVPYNYLLNRSTRSSIDLDWSNDVVIIDESHNLESVCSEAVSFDLTPAVRLGCQKELTQSIDRAVKPRGISFPALDELARSSEGERQVVGTENREAIEFRLLKQILVQMEDAISRVPLPPRGATPSRTPPFAVHPASYLRDMMGGVDGFNAQSAPLVLEVLERAMESSPGGEAEDKPPRGAGGQETGSSSSNSSFLRTLHDAIRVLFDPSLAKYQDCFRTVVRPVDAANPAAGRTVSYWCFSPAVAMSDFMALGIRSLVLTSGTLSPMDSFSSELGVKFPVRLENRHVIGPDQVLGSILCSGPDGVRLSSSYQSRETDDYKLSLGRTIVQVVRVIPDGVLVFFPSYRAMESCLEFWRSVGSGEGGRGASIYERIRQSKRIIEEPRGSGDFAAAILGHQANIRGGHGSLLFAVCRGKVSEGIDFSDAYGRAVIMAGIPYPAALDPKVLLKKQFMDQRVQEARRSSEQRDGAEAGRGQAQPATAISGEDWYTLQAVRAVNQAIGRAIRHKNDFGFVLFCDERFSGARMQAQLSKWLRPYISVAASFDAAQSALQEFFAHAKGAPFAMQENAKHKRRRADAGSGAAPARGAVANPLSCRSGISAINDEEADVQIAAASRAIARFVPPQRSNEEVQEEVNRIAAGLNLPALPSEAPTAAAAESGRSEGTSLLDLLGARPQLSGTLRQTPPPGGSGGGADADGPRMSTSAQFIAKRGRMGSKGPAESPISGKLAEGGNGRRRLTNGGGEASAPAPAKRAKLSDDAKALFDDEKNFRTTFTSLRRILAFAKQVSEGAGPLQDGTQGDEAVRRGNEEVAVLVGCIRLKCSAQADDAQVASFLRELRAKIPRPFVAAYDAAVSRGRGT